MVADASLVPEVAREQARCTHERIRALKIFPFRYPLCRELLWYDSRNIEAVFRGRLR